jgi:CTP:molybdopterin cytidylyltransferase MocA
VTVAAVVLAAGEATRFGAPKQRILLPSVLDSLEKAPVHGIVVVEGAYSLDLPRGLAVFRQVVRCDDWARGPGASLRCGLAALEPEVDAAVVVLADGPHLSPEAVERVLDTWRSEGGVVAASYDGHRGHPLVIGRDLWASVPDEGLHGVPTRLVPCDDLGAPGDVDTPDDLPEGLR